MTISPMPVVPVPTGAGAPAPAEFDPALVQDFRNLVERNLSEQDATHSLGSDIAAAVEVLDAVGMVPAAVGGAAAVPAEGWTGAAGVTSDESTVGISAIETRAAVASTVPEVTGTPAAAGLSSGPPKAGGQRGGPEQSLVEHSGADPVGSAPAAPRIDTAPVTGAQERLIASPGNPQTTDAPPVTPGSQPSSGAVAPSGGNQSQAPAGTTTPSVVPASPVSPREQVHPVVARMVERGDGVHRVTLRLHPEELGEVRVTVVVKNSVVDVTLSAGSMALAALRDGSPQLRALLDLAGATTGQVVVRELPGPQPATSGGLPAGSAGPLGDAPFGNASHGGREGTPARRDIYPGGEHDHLAPERRAPDPPAGTTGTTTLDVRI